MKFGVREIVDVVFKATTNGQRIGNRTFKKYQPVFMIDTATTSSLEQATTTVYAQGGKGYARLIAWEGEKTMTFTVTDALMSPMGLAVLTGAGLINPVKGSSEAHVHTTLNVAVDSEGKAEVGIDELNEEFGLNADDYAICKTIEMFATELDGSGAGINWFDGVSVAGGDVDSTEYVHITAEAPAVFTVPSAASTTVQLDFYTIMNNSVTEVQIEPSSFGGYFYVEAQTLFRREDTGKDMAAEIIIPKAKVQSAFTFTMAASGDPSTFDFVMDAFPGYTRFDNTKKQMCVIQIVGDDKKATDDTGVHTHDDKIDKNIDVVAPLDSPSIDELGTKASAVPASVFTDADVQANQNKLIVSKVSSGTEDFITLKIAGGVDSLNAVDVPGTTGWGTEKWVATAYDTGKDTIKGLVYVNRGTETTLTDDDVAEAAAAGLPAGTMIIWTKADVAKETPATFSLKDDKGIFVNATIKAVDGE